MILSPVPLYLVPLIAALGAAVLLLGDFGRRARVGLLSIAGSLVLLLVASAPLFRRETPFTAGPRIARMGSLDATLSLSLTPMSALLAGAMLVGAAALLGVRGSAPRTRASEAAIVGLAAAVTLGTLADGFPALIAGTIGFGLMLAALVGRDTQKGGGRVLLAVAIASIFLALGSAVLFWDLGGKFLDGRRYLSDYHARFVASSDAPELPQASGQKPKGDIASLAPDATGELTMTTNPGARVYLGIADEGQLVGRPPDAVSPFVGFKVRSGVQKIAIDPGGGSLVGGDGQEVALVDDVRFPPGSHVTIDAVGPTVTFREISSQLEKPGGDLASRKLGSVPLLDLARATIALALLALAFAVGSAGGAPSARSLGALGAVALAGATRERLGALFGDAGALPVLVGFAAACAALGYGALSPRTTSPSALTARAAGWLTATALLAIPFGAPAGSAVAAAGAALGLLATSLVLDGEADALLRGAPKLEPVVRPASVAVAAGSIATAAVVGFGCTVRGGSGGIASAAFAITGTLLFAFAFFRAFFGLKRDPGTHPEEAPKEARGKKKKRKKAEPATHTEVPGAIARIVAILAATGIVLAVVGAWLSKQSIEGHRGLAVGLPAVVAIGVAVAASRARSIAMSEDFTERMSEAKRSRSGRIANGDDRRATRRKAMARGFGARMILAIDGAFAWPGSVLGGRSSPNDEGAAS